MSKMPESEAWVDDERKRIQYTTKCVVGTHNKACGLFRYLRTDAPTFTEQMRH